MNKLDSRFGVTESESANYLIPSHQVEGNLEVKMRKNDVMNPKQSNDFQPEVIGLK